MLKKYWSNPPLLISVRSPPSATKGVWLPTGEAVVAVPRGVGRHPHTLPHPPTDAIRALAQRPPGLIGAARTAGSASETGTLECVVLDRRCRSPRQ